MKKLNRRQLVSAAGGIALAAMGLGGCKNKPSGPNCEDTAALTPEQIKLRQGLKYIPVSNLADKNCSNCKLYKPPASSKECGGCTLFPGPVTPGGYCMGWQAKS